MAALRLLQFLRAAGERAVGLVEAPDTVRVLAGCDLSLIHI